MTNNTCPICGNDTFSKVFDCKDHFVSGETFEIVECEKCKMRITKDFPAENEIGKYYETSDYISHSDTKKGIVNAVYHRVRKLMLRKKAGWIEENTGLIWSVVKRFQGRGYDKEDLFQIGSIGLLKCIDNFDLERKVKFSTYAVPLIMGEIKRFLRDDGLVKVSRSLKEASYKIKREKEHYEKFHS